MRTIATNISDAGREVVVDKQDMLELMDGVQVETNPVILEDPDFAEV